MTTAQGLLQLLDTHVTRDPALALQDMYVSCSTRASWDRNT